MERYTIYCTAEQVKKALNLGAPIILESEYYTPTENDFKLDNPIPCESYTCGYHYAKCPTAEQMIGWLETKISEVFISTTFGSWEFVLYKSRTEEIVTNKGYSSRKEATLAAIDAALEYLANKAMEE